MKMTHLGHAGWIFEHKKFKLVCDPWLDPAGAYFSGWFQFPSNEHLLDTDIFKNINYIYVSHRHNDHFDSWFLKQLDKEIQVLIPKFRDKRLRNDFRKLGFKNIRELKVEMNLFFHDEWYLILYIFCLKRQEVPHLGQHVWAVIFQYILEPC